MSEQDFIEEEKNLKDQEILLTYQGEDRIITSHEAWDELKEERNKPIIRFLTKIPTLDKMLDGIRKGDIVVVSGITKQGKTSFCRTLTVNFTQEKIPCLWFSYEERNLEFLERFKEPLPFFTLPRKLKGNSFSWIDERICESIAKYGTKIVFIDHLHFLLDISYLGQRGNSSLIIGGIMRELKKIALNRDICIILIAHTKMIKTEDTIDLSSIRDSSFISQEADTVLIIGRKFNTENESVLRVLANRRTGQNGKINLLFNNGIFLEETKIYDKNNSESIYI